MKKKDLGKVVEVEDEKVPSSCSQLHNLSVNLCLVLSYVWLQQRLIHMSRSLHPVSFSNQYYC